METASTLPEVRLADLIAATKDGEWGSGEPSTDSVEVAIVRGTDFAKASLGDISQLPVRHVASRRLATKQLRPNDIVIETAGGSKNRPTGRTFRVTADFLERCGRPVVCASFCRFIRVDPSRADPGYVFWALQSMYASGRMAAFNTQHTGVSRFQWTDFAASRRLMLPSPVVQLRVARLLSTFDDLIEINERRIALLEDLTRSLYREWFVRKRASSWEHRTLGDVTSVITRGVAPKYDDDGRWLVVNQRCIRDGRVSLAPARRHGREVTEQKRVQRYDSLINSTGVGTLGRVGVFMGQDADVTVDTHVTIVRAERSEDSLWLATSPG